jgi:hypothetical protein
MDAFIQLFTESLEEHNGALKFSKGEGNGCLNISKIERVAVPILPHTKLGFYALY